MVMEIALIYVEEAYRDQGYGKKLMEYILHYIKAVCPDTNKIILSPLPLDNNGLKLKDLIEFYRKFGFKESDIHLKDKPYIMELILYV